MLKYKRCKGLFSITITKIYGFVFVIILTLIFSFIINDEFNCRWDIIAFRPVEWIFIFFCCPFSGSNDVGGILLAFLHISVTKFARMIFPSRLYGMKEMTCLQLFSFLFEFECCKRSLFVRYLSTNIENQT